MQVQNNKEEVPFAHYEEKFASLDPQEAAARCGVPFENGRFTVTLLGTAYQIAWPKYAISSEDEAAFALKSLPCQTFLLRFLLEGRGGGAVRRVQDVPRNAVGRDVYRAVHRTGSDAGGVHIRHARGKIPRSLRKHECTADPARRRGLPV